MKHQGKKSASRQIVGKLESADYAGEAFGESGRQVQRYIRLTELIYQLLDKVDMKLILVMAGAELSYVDVRNQVIINDVLDCECCGLSLKQAIKLKRYYLDGNISEEIIADIILEKERNDNGKVILQYDRLRKYFPEHYTPKECEDALWKILEVWFKNM
ncbi:MAG: hypothetical protein IJH37_00140 [Clostridia bacterium]|nr:hypothetical protein [Clostridia bacterium]